MNSEPTDRRDAGMRDADALDAFWDELVLGQFSGETPRQAASPNETMVMTLQSLLSPGDDGAEARLRRLVFGTAPEPAVVSGPVRPMPVSRPEPIRPTWSIRKYTQLAAAALAVILIGALVAAQIAGFFGSRGDNDTPTAIPAAIAQLDATPAALASPTISDDAILWSLPFDGTNVEVGSTALSNGTLYRLIRSDEFTGVQAVDTASGTEKWRSAQEWSGNGIAAGADSVALLTDFGVTALDPASGDPGWTTELPDMAPVSLVQRDAAFWVWDGISKMVTLNAKDGRIGSPADAGLTVAPDTVPAGQAPVATENGVAAVSAAGTIVLFGATVNVTATAGSFEPETVVLDSAPDGNVVIAGAARLETEGPWARKLLLVDPADGSTRWETDYNALVTGLAVNDTMVFMLADNPGMAYSVTNDGFTYPEQTSPQIYGYELATGQMYFEMDETTGTGHGWVSDAGVSPYVALASGPGGSNHLVAISENGRLTAYTTDSPLVAGEIDLGAPVVGNVAVDDAGIYTALADGSLVAVAPSLFSQRPLTEGIAAGGLQWSVPLGAELVDFGGMDYGNGLVYRLIETPAGRELQATYATTGQPSWSLPFDWGIDQLAFDATLTQGGPNSSWTGSGNLFVVDVENRVIALNGSAGTVSWQHAFERPVVSMTVDRGTLFVWDESGTMTALDSADGAVLWATSSGSAGGPQTNEFGMPVPVATSAIVAMVDAEGNLHGFDRSTGEALWSTPGFNGTNARLLAEGDATSGQEEWLVILKAVGEPHADGTFELNAHGVLALTGEHRWSDYLTGPLVQPTSTDETYVLFIGDQAITGKDVTVRTTPVVDAESPRHFVWTDTGPDIASNEPGGSRLFAIDVATGEIVWIRTTIGPEFTGLVFDPIFARGQAVTANGLLVSPAGGSGWIDSAPLELGGPVLSTTSSGEMTGIGSFATLADGTLVAYGGWPSSQQG